MERKLYTEMWHLSFAAANLVLSVATVVAFSTKLSKRWVKLKTSGTGTSADKESLCVIKGNL